MYLASAQKYQQVLKSEFENRFRRNRGYSLRAYARDLGLSVASLSDVMNGKHGLSVRRAALVAEKLKLRPRDKQWFCDLVESQNSRSQEKRKLASIRLRQHQLQDKSQVSLDTFRAISGWEHFAILQLTRLKKFRPDAKWIARALEIEVARAEKAVERLFRLEMLKEVDGKWVTQPFYVTPAGKFDDGLRCFNSALLLKAQKALHEQIPLEQNITSGTLMAFDKSQLERARQLLREFRLGFTYKFEPGKEDALYCLSIGFFQMDTGKNDA